MTRNPYAEQDADTACSPGAECDEGCVRCEPEPTLNGGESTYTPVAQARDLFLVALDDLRALAAGRRTK